MRIAKQIEIEPEKGVLQSLDLILSNKGLFLVEEKESASGGVVAEITVNSSFMLQHWSTQS